MANSEPTKKQFWNKARVIAKPYCSVRRVAKAELKEKEERMPASLHAGREKARGRVLHQVQEYPNTIGWLGRYLGSYVPGDRQLKTHSGSVGSSYVSCACSP